MKTVSRLNAIFLSCRLMMSVSVLSILCLGCSAFDNEPPIPPKDYDLPPEIRTEVFSNELTGEVGDVDAFLDRIIKAGMVIHEGPNPPEIYTFSDLGAVNNRIAVIFSIDNDCIYDERSASNIEAEFGKYLEGILILRSQGYFTARLYYSSLETPAYPQYPDGYDTGLGVGYASGNGNHFTMFIRVENGSVDQIPYQALWIISGTVSNSPNPEIMSDVTKCLVMLEKGSDPEDKVADSGTIRIFKDQSPDRLYP